MKELFNGLMNLCKTNEAFYYSDQDYEDNYMIRSFTYRLASWTDFQEPYARDSRGTAFIFNKDTNKWSLFCKAYPKFHNLGEGIPKEDFIKNNKVLVSYEKLDGSLILVGRVNNKLIAKSKTSINSNQAVAAQRIINNNIKLQLFCNIEISRGRTPVFELIGPDNVIVLRYKENELVFLGSVINTTGKIDAVKTMDDYNYLKNMFSLKSAKPYNHTWEELLHIQETSKPVIEGFVTETENGLVKIKC